MKGDFSSMAKRDIKGHIEEGRRWLRSHEREAAVIDLSVKELKYFYDRIEGGADDRIDVLCDMFCFAFAVGYRAGRRAAK
jgi:hypothetical protein